ERDCASDPSLASGAAGLGLLHGYLAQTDVGRIGNPAIDPRVAIAIHSLQRAAAAMADKPAEASLYGGLTGVGWALAHLQGRLLGLDGEDDVADIDEGVLNHLDKSPWGDDYDLINGLGGLGVYARERLPRPTAIMPLERVVAHLGETAELRPEGSTWWTTPAWLPAATRATAP